MNKKVKSSLLLLTTAIIWGFAFVAQRVGTEHVGPLTFNGIRFFLGSLSLIPVILIFEREPLNNARLKDTFVFGVLAGVALFAASILQQYGIMETKSAGKSGFITGLYTVLVPILNLFIFKKKTGINIWIGAAFSVSGLFLLCMTGNSLVFGRGDILLIIGAVFWACHILVIDKVAYRVSTLKFSMTQFFVCGILGCLGAVLFERDIFSLSYILSAATPILYAGIMSAGVAYTCQIVGQKDADPTKASIILSTESVFSAIGGALLLPDEIMTARGYLGCLLIFLGIVLSQLNFSKQKA